MMVKIDKGIKVDGIGVALNSISIRDVRIPLIEVTDKDNRIGFVAYFISMNDPIYERVKNETPESLADACRAVYFYIKKDKKIDLTMLIKALKNKIKGSVRKQKRLDSYVA